MEAKEKAKELIDRFVERIEDVGTDRDEDIRTAQQCALICVDEIIQTYHAPMDDAQIEEWQEVIKELKNS